MIVMATLPTDRWLPGLGWDETGHRHLVLAGTPSEVGKDEWFRAVCGATTLRMPFSTPNWPYEYATFPRCLACRRWRAGEVLSTDERSRRDR